MLKEVVIVAAARTPVGSFRGSLAALTAPQLGAVCSKAVFDKVQPSHVDEIFFGNVLSANIGQAPVTQMSRLAGIPATVPCTSINKVCASGMKSIILGTQSIQTGHNSVVLCGGMESMSNVPYYLPNARQGYAYGHQQAVDGILKDGLWDSGYDIHMGQCAEETATKYNISRQDQDEHAIESYKRAAKAWKDGLFQAEIASVEIRSKRGNVTVSEDEEFTKVNFDKVPTLRPVFKKDGSVTAANASTLNDGASAVLICSAEKASELGAKPIAKILAYADSNRDPKEFTIAPADAINKALKLAGLRIKDVSLFEINEAFSVVVRANEKILGLDKGKVNVSGGAVALGHPIGSSGSRIMVTLTHLLKKGEIGCASICNGGGGASAMLIQKL